MLRASERNWVRHRESRKVVQEIQYKVVSFVTTSWITDAKRNFFLIFLLNEFSIALPVFKQLANFRIETERRYSAIWRGRYSALTWAQLILGAGLSHMEVYSLPSLHLRSRHLLQKRCTPLSSRNSSASAYRARFVKDIKIKQSGLPVRDYVESVLSNLNVKFIDFTCTAHLSSAGFLRGKESLNTPWLKDLLPRMSKPTSSVVVHFILTYFLQVRCLLRLLDKQGIHQIF